MDAFTALTLVILGLIVGVALVYLSLLFLFSSVYGVSSLLGKVLKWLIDRLNKVR